MKGEGTNARLILGVVVYELDACLYQSCGVGVEGVGQFLLASESNGLMESESDGVSWSRSRIGSW